MASESGSRPMVVEEGSSPQDPSCRPGTVLIAEDEPTLLGAYERALSEAGYQVRTAIDGREAEALLSNHVIDVLISDVVMPDMDGIELLRMARRRDLDLPVILISGTPSMETAMKAVQHGALRYLPKPVDLGVLEEVVEEALRMRRMATLKREALRIVGAMGMRVGDRAGLEVAFERGLSSLWMAYQPIVEWSGQRVYCYEALLRTAEPTLPDPGAFLEAAEQLGRLHDLGRLIRARVADAIGRSSHPPRVFVNLHPKDLMDEDLYSSDAPLSRSAREVVLEITERASLDKVEDLTARVAALRAMGYRIAVDDLGAGYAGLSSFARLRPEVVKIDMSLVRNVDSDPTRQKLISSLTTLCAEIGMQVVAEGVETVEERRSLVHLGCDLLQGYLFAMPAGSFVVPRW